MTETQAFKFRLPKPETNVGMAFLGHQDSKAPITNSNKVGAFGKDSGVPNRKRLIIKLCIPNPNTLKNNNQDSKPIDDAVNLTSEKHDLYTQKSPTQKKKTRIPCRRHRCGAGQILSEG